MTKKGIILAVVLAVLIILIALVAISQGNKPNSVSGNILDIEQNVKVSDKFALYVNNDTGLDIRTDLRNMGFQL